MSETNHGECGRCAAARREFLTKSAVGGIAGVAAVGAPALVGVTTMFDPIVDPAGAKAADGACGAECGSTSDGAATEGTEVRLASLAALNADGTPLRVVVYLDQIDGWNTTPNQPVGGVWLRKNEQGEVLAFHLSCPHAGCGIQYNTNERFFYCPCHGATFDLNGVRREAKSESPRDLDSLNVRMDGDDVYVAFQNFSFGTAEKESI